MLPSSGVFSRHLSSGKNGENALHEEGDAEEGDAVGVMNGAMRGEITTTTASDGQPGPNFGQTKTKTKTKKFSAKKKNTKKKENTMKKENTTNKENTMKKENTTKKENTMMKENTMKKEKKHNKPPLENGKIFNLPVLLSRRVIIRNLPPSATLDGLLPKVSIYGDLSPKKASIRREMQGGGKIAEVEFLHLEDAIGFVEEVNERVLDGRKLFVGFGWRGMVLE